MAEQGGCHVWCGHGSGAAGWPHGPGCWDCLDRIYLNGYVPMLQVVAFLHAHLGTPIASPAVIEQIGTRFRQVVARFAENNDISMVKFQTSGRST